MCKDEKNIPFAASRDDIMSSGNFGAHDPASPFFPKPEGCDEEAYAAYVARIKEELTERDNANEGCDIRPIQSPTE